MRAVHAASLGRRDVNRTSPSATSARNTRSLALPAPGQLHGWGLANVSVWLGGRDMALPLWRRGCGTVVYPIINGILHLIAVTPFSLRHLRCLGPSRQLFFLQCRASPPWLHRPLPVRPRCFIPCLQRSRPAPCGSRARAAPCRRCGARPCRSLTERRPRSGSGNGLCPGVCFGRSARRGAQSLGAKFVRRDSPVERGSGAMRRVLGRPRRSLSGPLPYHLPVLGVQPSISRC